MIQLYPKGTTDFSTGGIVLHPTEASVTWASGGRYDMTMTIPREMAANISFDYGQIVRCPVPVQHVDTIDLGAVAYWKVTAAAGSTLYSEAPTLKTIGYKPWQIDHPYAVGAKVSYARHNYQCNYFDETNPWANISPDRCGWWTEIARTSGSAGKVIGTVAYNTVIAKIADFNDTYMEVSCNLGHGFIKAEDCADQGTTGERTIPAWTITEQSFQIITIEKEEAGHAIRIDAEHISYQLGRTMLGDCKVSGINPATALLFVVGAMKEDYPGEIATNIRDITVEGDWSWKNAQAAILDPKSGILQASGGMIIRDNYNVYLLPNAEETPSYQVTYGANLKKVKWTGDVSGIVTRIYPTAQAADGSTLMLPEEHIDTVHTVPFVRPEMLKTDLKVGNTITETDGTEVTLTEDEVYTRMREQAQNRFDIDKADEPEIKLDLDWVHMPDTEEYAQYQDLINAAPLQWVKVVNGPMGLNTVIQMTGYTFDALLERYEKSTFGSQKEKASVASYSIQNGAVTSSSIAKGAVTGANMAAGSISAREIEAGSITADELASKIINTNLLAAEAVTASEIAAQAISTEKLAAGSVTAAKIASGTITADQIASGTITTVLLAADAVTADKIASESITAGKIAAGAVSASNIAAGAVTAEKIAADAVTADKIAANAIDADAISTNAIDAINAKLGIASIADAQIANADIDYAKVKDLNADSAYFGQAVIQDGLANKLFVPRLSVAYAQIVNATISDLVIQATDEKFYKLDVDLDGNVTATEVSVSQSEIESGHTSDGRTLYLGTDIVAEDLNTTNIYASHALMDQITANIINVDKLLAREAVINWLNVQDLSSNTYIRSTVGTWESGSTITQTINGINSRISSLGYGTVYMQPTEPDHENLSSGDIWLQTGADSTWQQVSETYATWAAVLEGASTWQVVGGIPVMWVWDGRAWKKMYDAYLPTTLETQIEQLADAINLRATKNEVNLLSGQVTSMSAQLSIQAGQIESAVSTVNAKAASFVQWDDPSDEYDITLGDIWIKTATGIGSWADVNTEHASWQEVYTTYDSWLRLQASATYVWDGTQWVETSDRAAEINLDTRITQTSKAIELMAEAEAKLQDNIYRLSASLSIAAGEIRAEVERASTAEAGKISKTSQYQTADAIVSEAVSQATSEADGSYLKKTTTYQDAQSIVNEAVSQSANAASGAYIAKTATYQTAEGIKGEAVRVAGVNADNKYLVKSADYGTVTELLRATETQAQNAATTAASGCIAKTTTYQTADAIVNSAVAAIDNVPVFSTSTAYAKGQVVVYGGHMYKFNRAHAAGAWSSADATLIGVGSSYIAQTENYATADSIFTAAKSYVNNTLVSYSTIEQTSDAISLYVTNNAYKIQSGIGITASGIDITGSKYIKLASGSLFEVNSPGFGVYSNASGDSYVMWAGSSTAANAPFRVTANGKVTLTDLMALNESGVEEPVNLNTTALWKLGYHTVKSYDTNSITLSNGAVVNFNTAASVVVSSVGWSGATGTITLSNGATDSGLTIHAKATNAGNTAYPVTVTSTANKAGTANIVVQSTGSLGTGTITTDTVLLNLSSVFTSAQSLIGIKSVSWNGTGTGTITLDNDNTGTLTIHAKGSNTSGSAYPVTVTSTANKTGTASIVVQSTGSLGTGTVSTDTVGLDLSSVFTTAQGLVSISSVAWDGSGSGTITLSNNATGTLTVHAKGSNASGSAYPVTVTSTTNQRGTASILVQSTGSLGTGTVSTDTVGLDLSSVFTAAQGLVSVSSVAWNGTGAGTITLSNTNTATLTIHAKASNASGSNYPVTVTSSANKVGTASILVQSTGSLGTGTVSTDTVGLDLSSVFNTAQGLVSISSVTWNGSGSGTITLSNNATGTLTVHAKGSNASGSPYPVTVTSTSNKTGTASIVVQSSGSLGTGTVSTDTVGLNLSSVFDAAQGLVEITGIALIDTLTEDSTHVNVRATASNGDTYDRSFYIGLPRSGAYQEGVASVTLSSAWVDKTLTVTASNDEKVTINVAATSGVGTPSSTDISISTFDSSHKANAQIFATGKSGTLIGVSIDASSEYTAGRNSVAFSTATWGSKTYNSSLHGYTMPLNVTLTNGKDTDYTATVSASEAYDDGVTKGWNDCVDDIGAGEGTTVYTGTKAQLYDPTYDVYITALRISGTYQIPAKQ